MSDHDPAGLLDVHAHFLTERYVEECRLAGITQPDGMPGFPAWSPELALETMASAGIGAAILSLSSPGVHFGADDPSGHRAAVELARHVNDAGASLVRDRPASFGLSAALPLPDVDGALAEIARAYDELQADAVTMLTNYRGQYLSDPRFEPVLAELDARRAVVTLHPTSPPGWEQTSLGHPRPMLEFIFETTRCVTDLALTGAFARHPNIRWIVPHAGAALPIVSTRVSAMSVLAGTPVDMAGILGTLYFDLAGMPLPAGIPALTTVAGPERLLYGSDFPFTPAPTVSFLASTLWDTSFQAEFTLRPGSTAAALFPRLAALPIGSC
jgi:6-methylsalicylate decarboxylase